MHTGCSCKCMGSVRGPPTFICSHASVTPTPGRPAISPCRRLPGWRLHSRRGRRPRRWARSPSRGGRGAGWQRDCCGPIIAPSKGAAARPFILHDQEVCWMAGLNGPRLEPRGGGAARQLVVFLHGYGADGNDLIEIGRAWEALMPNAGFVSPHAPEVCATAGAGRQWFGLTFRDPQERWTGVNAAAPILERFLDTELQRRNPAPSALALVGFSQGPMRALHVGLRRAPAPPAH